MAREELRVGVEDRVERLHPQAHADASGDHGRVPGVEVEHHLPQQDRDEREQQKDRQRDRQVEEVHELPDRLPDDARAVEDGRLTAVGVLEDGQQQREADTFEECEEDGKPDQPSDLGPLDFDDGEHPPYGVDA